MSVDAIGVEAVADFRDVLLMHSLFLHLLVVDRIKSCHLAASVPA